jgi:hypothetical protein
MLTPGHGPPYRPAHKTGLGGELKTRAGGQAATAPHVPGRRMCGPAGRAGAERSEAARQGGWAGQRGGAKGRTFRRTLASDAILRNRFRPGHGGACCRPGRGDVLFFLAGGLLWVANRMKRSRWVRGNGQSPAPDSSRQYGTRQRQRHLGEPTPQASELRPLEMTGLKWVSTSKLGLGLSGWAGRWGMFESGLSGEEDSPGNSAVVVLGAF